MYGCALRRLLPAALLGLALSGSAVAYRQDPACTTDSDQVSHFVTSPIECGVYAETVTRFDTVGGVQTPALVRYMVHAPAGTPRALVVLLAGGTGDAGIRGNVATGKIRAAGDDFLVRSAALFAEKGFLAVTLDRPTTEDGSTTLEYDLFRLSPAHAQDIVSVVDGVNTQNLDVFLLGTDRGTLSAVAQHRLGLAVGLSSPVTDGPALYIGHPQFSALKPTSLDVPVHVMTHLGDQCASATPKGAKLLVSQIRAVAFQPAAFGGFGVPVGFSAIRGGFDLSNGSTVLPCDAETFHGYLGAESASVVEHARFLIRVLVRNEFLHPGNRRPVASGTGLTTSSITPVSVDLATLASDADFDPLKFSLPFTTSSRGAAISLSGSIATYTPIAGGIEDGFVYAVSDGKDGKANAIVKVVVGP